MTKLEIAISLMIGFGIGVWFQYLNVCFWKWYVNKKYKTQPQEVEKTK